MQNNSTASGASLEDLTRTIAEVSGRMSQYPTALVMTHSTFKKAKMSIDQSCQTSQSQNVLAGDSCLGLRIETFETVNQCMDRMMNQRSGERLQLVLGEDIPGDCFGHPYMRMMAEKMAERFCFDPQVMGYLPSKCAPSRVKYMA